MRGPESRTSIPEEAPMGRVIETSESYARELEAAIADKINNKELSGVMIQQMVDDFAAGRIRSREDAIESIRQVFKFDPFSGNKLEPEQVE